MPWQVEQTCWASVVAETAGLPSSRERSGLLQAANVATTANDQYKCAINLS
jgi:hypothetical protein